jgi:hypothetical protein
MICAAESHTSNHILTEINPDIIQINRNTGLLYPAFAESIKSAMFWRY